MRLERYAKNQDSRLKNWKHKKGTECIWLQESNFLMKILKVHIDLNLERNRLISKKNEYVSTSADLDIKNVSKTGQKMHEHC